MSYNFAGKTVCGMHKLIVNMNFSWCWIFKHLSAPSRTAWDKFNANFTAIADGSYVRRYLAFSAIELVVGVGFCVWREGVGLGWRPGMYQEWTGNFVPEYGMWPRYFTTVMSESARWRLKSPVLWVFTQPSIQAQIKENIKAPRHWPLWGEFTGDRRISRTKDQRRGKCFHLMTSSCSYREYRLLR